jgi:hypothetical protein
MGVPVRTGPGSAWRGDEGTGRERRPRRGPRRKARINAGERKAVSRSPASFEWSAKRAGASIRGGSKTAARSDGGVRAHLGRSIVAEYTGRRARWEVGHLEPLPFCPREWRFHSSGAAARSLPPPALGSIGFRQRGRKLKKLCRQTSHRCWCAPTTVRMRLYQGGRAYFSCQSRRFRLSHLGQ